MLDFLLKLSHDLGSEQRGLAILGEGNTSWKESDQVFHVKASGSSLGTLREDQITACQTESLLALFEESSLSDQEVDDALLASRVSEESKKPSVEAVFHAYLLSLPDVSYVGHTHPITINQILCAGKGKLFAESRLFPDQIVCCGEKSLLIPYTDPGLVLAQEIKRGIESFRETNGNIPNTILIENHGFIALGKTPQQVLSATLMAEKSAQIFVGAMSLSGQQPSFLTDAQVRRISGRPDEHYRQKILSES